VIDFQLSPEQQSFRDLARDFARHEIVPVAGDYDRSAEFPWPVVHKAFEVGLVYPNIPEEYGGAGIDLVSECLLREELSWGCAGISGAIGLSPLIALGLMIGGSEEQKRRYLPELIRERKLAAYALTEPGAGSDAAAIQTRAVRHGDDYAITGSKCFITIASEASYFLVFAKTNADDPHRGVSAFLVPRGTSGLTVGKKDDKMGQRAAGIAQVFFEDVKVPKRDRIGAEGEGFKLAMEVFNRSRPLVGAKGVGVARRAFEMASEYANQRRTFGKPIIDHQGVGFLLADMYIQIEAARLLCWKAAWLADRGCDNSVAAAAAKCFAADTAMRVTTDAVQVLGGYGYIRDYGVEKLMRDAKVIQIYEGTTQIQRLIIAKKLKRRAGAAS